MRQSHPRHRGRKRGSMSKLCASAEVVEAVRAWQAALERERDFEHNGPPYAHERYRIEHRKLRDECRRTQAKAFEQLRTATIRIEAEVRREERERCAALIETQAELLPDEYEGVVAGYADDIRAMGDDDG